MTAVVPTGETALDLCSQAQEVYTSARSALEQGDLHRALENIDQARLLFEAGGDRLAALRTDLGRINVLDDLGRHHEAVSTGYRLRAGLVDATRSTTEADDAGLLRWLEAAAAENLGASLGWLGNHDAAAASLRDAAAAYEEAGSSVPAVPAVPFSRSQATI